jgi:hypothetical protein
LEKHRAMSRKKKKITHPHTFENMAIRFFEARQEFNKGEFELAAIRIIAEQLMHIAQQGTDKVPGDNFSGRLSPADLHRFQEVLEALKKSNDNLQEAMKKMINCLEKAP